MPALEIRTSTNFYNLTVFEFRSLLQLTRSLHLFTFLFGNSGLDCSRCGDVFLGGRILLRGPKRGVCPESRLRSAYSILGISAENLGDTLISKWGFRSGGGGRRIKYPILLSEFGPKMGILAGVGRVKLAKFENTAKSYRN